MTGFSRAGPRRLHDQSTVRQNRFLAARSPEKLENGWLKDLSVELAASEAAQNKHGISLFSQNVTALSLAVREFIITLKDDIIFFRR